MLFDKKNIPPEKLIALKFTDAETFRRAARIAVEHDIPVDTPGSYTLIIRKSDKRLFKGFPFEDHTVADPEKVPPEELHRLRKQRFHAE
ncbi:MAG: hypothetical protein HYZ81_05485 [Nitrospinae bacterium]|nr:hypothetical protein [Nitrospinota bacterium]